MKLIIEQADNYSDKPALTDGSAIVGLSGNSGWFIFKQKITGKTVDGGTRNFEAMELLKYLSNFC